VTSGTAIRLPIKPSTAVQSLTYLAPKQELSEVISVACFRGFIDCTAGGTPDDLLATTTERILIRKATSATPTPSEEPDAGEGGEAGQADGRIVRWAVVTAPRS
jgi:hypothetical protein